MWSVDRVVLTVEETSDDAGVPTEEVLAAEVNERKALVSLARSSCSTVTLSHLLLLFTRR